MKPTVDLTADRMFPDSRVPRAPKWLLDGSDDWDSTFRILTFSFRIPWEVDELKYVCCDEELNDWRFQLSGSAKDYRQREEWRKADSIDYCDRCGKRIRTPWRWDRTLCDDCSKQLTIEVKGHKVPWDNDSFWSDLTTNITTIRGIGS